MLPKPPRLCVLQHVPFEDPAAIKNWVVDKGACLSVVKFYQGDALPSQNDFDWLIIMGGPMGVYDVERYPWIALERHFILQTIKMGKCVLGICLGAQLIAAVLGATVKKNTDKEIGWFNVKRRHCTSDTFLNEIWPDTIEAFHWHGETFDLPSGAQLIASSDACKNQGFVFENRVVALQFHLEVTPQSVALLIKHCSDELDNSKYVQSAHDLANASHAYTENNQLLYRLLDRLEA